MLQLRMSVVDENMITGETTHNVVNELLLSTADERIPEDFDHKPRMENINRGRKSLRRVPIDARSLLILSYQVSIANHTEMSTTGLSSENL